MRKYLGLAIVVALVLSVVPALAGESFHALTPLPDAQLVAIEGSGGEVEMCVVCLNIATVHVTNVAVGNDNVQHTLVVVHQNINR
jgi:hypothetical protein